MTMINDWNPKVVARLEKDWNKRKHSYSSEVFALTNSYGNSFLDIGCGYGRFYDFLVEERSSKTFSYIGYDSSEAMITRARAKHPDITHNFYLYDITKPFKTDVEVILCNGVLIHLLPEDQKRVLSNMNRCLCKIIILTIQTSKKSSRIEKPKLIGQKFWNVVQNLADFKKDISENITNVLSVDIQDYHLRRDVYSSVFIIKRKIENNK